MLKYRYLVLVTYLCTCTIGHTTSKKKNQINHNIGFENKFMACKIKIFSEYWVPGHIGIEGNAIADRPAGEGSSVNLIGPELYCGLSKCVYKSTIHDWFIAKTQYNWEQISRLRHSKEVIQSVSINKTRQYSYINLAEDTTENNYRNIDWTRTLQQLFSLLMPQNDICRFCNNDDETGKHIRECDS